MDTEAPPKRRGRPPKARTDESEQLAHDEAGNERPWSDLPADSPEKTCARCPHQTDEHESFVNVRVGDERRCMVEIPITMGDGSTAQGRCPCPGWLSVWVQRIIDQGPEQWADDQEHREFAQRHGLQFCADCGLPGTQHFRGHATVPAYEGADVCRGFRTEPDDEQNAPVVSIWPPERYEGQPVLEHTVAFAGKIVLAVDSQAHIDLWDRLHAGERVDLLVTLEAGGTAYTPVRSGGAHKSESVVIGMSRGRKVRVAEIHVGFLPLGEVDEPEEDEASERPKPELTPLAAALAMVREADA